MPELHVTKLQSPPTDLDGCKVFEPTDSTGEGAQSSLCKVGFYATPRQFVSKAKALNHPMGADNPVSDWVKRAILSMMTVDPASLALQHATRLKQILTWKSQLEKDEQKLTNSLPAHSKVIMEGKQVLLMQRNLESYGYDDPGVISLLSEGIKLTGHHDLPPYAEQKIVPCTSTKEQLELLEAQEHSKELSLRGCSGIVGHFGFGSGYGFHGRPL